MMGPAGAVLTLGRGMFGIGVMSMPYMFSLCGVSWGALLLLLFAVNATTMSAVLVAAAPAARSYEEAVRSCLGPVAECVLASNILLANVGTVTVYLQVAGGRLVSAASFHGFDGFWVSRMVVTGMCALATLPFTLPVKLTATYFTSFFSFTVSLCVVAAVIVESLNGEGHTAPVVHLETVMQGVPLSCYAFSAMSQVFPVYAELAPTRQYPQSIARVAAVASGIAGVIYAAIGIVAAQRFGTATAPNVLKNFEDSNPSLFHALGSLYAASCLLGVPLMLFPSRRSLNFLIFRGDAGIGPCVLALESIVLLAAAYALAIASHNMLLMIDLIGSVSAIAVDNVLPGMMFIYVTRQIPDPSGQASGSLASGAECEGAFEWVSRHREEESTPNQALQVQDKLRRTCHAQSWMRVLVLCIVIIGICAGVASFVKSLQKLWAGDSP